MKNDMSLCMSNERVKYLKRSEILDTPWLFFLTMVPLSGILSCSDRSIVNVMKSNPTRRGGKIKYQLASHGGNSMIECNGV